MSEPADAVEVTLRVTEVFEALGVPYLIGGALASILHGHVRTTQGADLVAELRLAHVDPLERALAGDFYVDAESMRAAVSRRGSFSVVHLESLFKVDVYVSRERPFERVRFERAAREVLATDPERTTSVSSAEDTLLAKLEWFREGGEVSERQWSDVLGILRARSDRLDSAYLRQWSEALGVGDLLERAFTAAVS